MQPGEGLRILQFGHQSTRLGQGGNPRQQGPISRDRLDRRVTVILRQVEVKSALVIPHPLIDQFFHALCLALESPRFAGFPQHPGNLG